LLHRHYAEKAVMSEVRADLPDVLSLNELLGRPSPNLQGHAELVHALSAAGKLLSWCIKRPYQACINYLASEKKPRRINHGVSLRLQSDPLDTRM